MGCRAAQKTEKQNKKALKKTRQILKKQQQALFVVSKSL
jgi:hypothetical protein